MKNMTKTEIALTIAVIVLEVIAVIGLFTKGIPMQWSQFTIAFSALAVGFCSVKKNKEKNAKEADVQ